MAELLTPTASPLDDGRDEAASPPVLDGPLRQRTARGTIVNAVYFIGLSTLNLIKGFVVAAFLTRRDYGVWGIVAIGLGTLLWIRQVGINDKYVQQAEIDQEAAFQKAFTLELMFGAAFAALLLAAVPLIAVVYGRWEVLAPALVLVAATPAAALQSPIWVFYRRMDFVRQRTLEAVDPLVGIVVTVALAIAGAGYWSLVVGVLAGAWAASIVAVRASPYPLALRYDRGTMREYVSFSWPLFVAGLSGIVIVQGSILAGDRALGLAAVGSIALAASISAYTDRVDTILTATLYPAICAVRDRTELLFETFVKSNRLALMWGVPFGVGLTLFASDLVSYVLGDRWRPAVGLMQAFGVIAALNHIGFNWSAFYRARGDTRPMAVASFATMLAFLAIALPLMLTHGLGGFGLGMAVMAAVGVAVRFVYLARLFPGLQIARHAARAIAPTVPAVAAVLGLRLLDLHRTLGLALGELALYAVVTVAATLILERTLLREVLGYLRGGRASPRLAT